MQKKFTAYNPSTRALLYGGSCDVPEALPDPVLVGIVGDPKTQCMNEALDGIEPKRAMGANFDATTTVAGGSVTMTSVDRVDVLLPRRDVVLAEDVLEAVISFEEEGEYLIQLLPREAWVLPLEQIIVVT